MNNIDEKIKKELTTIYIRCPKCKESLIEYRDRQEIEGYIIDNFKYLKCPKCGKNILDTNMKSLIMK